MSTEIKAFAVTVLAVIVAMVIYVMVIEPALSEG